MKTWDGMESEGVITSCLLKIVIMNRIIKKEGYVYLVENWDKKGFETYHNLGKDPDSEMWKEQEEKPKQKKGKIKKETD